MKKYIFLQIARTVLDYLNRPDKQKLKRKIKYFLAFAIISSALFGGLAIWGAVVAVKQVAVAVDSNIPKVSLEEGKGKLVELANQPITSQKCLDRVYGLLSPNKWLTVPVAQNFASIKSACWN